VRGHRDLRLVLALAILCAILAPAIPLEALSLPLALPLSLFLPGYALTAAIFARRALTRQQVLVLSLGLSLCVLALGALPLNYVPEGIGPVSWAVLLALVVLGGCRAAALRRPRPSVATPDRAWASPRPTRAGAGFGLGAVLATAAAVVLTFSTTAAKHADGYTEMWLLPPAAKEAGAGGARVGVTSQEQERSAYLLRVRAGDRGGAVVHSFSLDPGETRVVRLRPAVAGARGAAVPVSAVLSLQSAPGDAYRRVSGWLAEPAGSR
jgi:uncharacterized membrane protein